jgi:hypothetical protein
MKIKRVFTFIIMLLASNAYALDWLDRQEEGKLFSNCGVQGTFVLYDLAADHLIGPVFGPQLALSRLRPSRSPIA